MIVLVPEPEVFISPGLLISVQVPDGGKLLRKTLPLDSEQVGFVIVPTNGAEGTAKIFRVNVTRSD